jgi:hypothetical protein
MQSQSIHKNELTTLVGSFLSKYDETATTGLERLCILLEKEISSSSSSSSLAKEFVKNEQVLATFIKVQNRAKVDSALFWKSVILLTLAHKNNNNENSASTKKERSNCLRILTSDLFVGGGNENNNHQKNKNTSNDNNKKKKNNNDDDDDDANNNNADDAAATEVVKNSLFSNLRKVLSSFDPESQDSKTKKNVIPIQQVERALQLCTLILKYNPFLLSSKLGGNFHFQQQSSSSSSVSFAPGIVDNSKPSSNATNQNNNNNHNKNAFHLPFEHFPLFSATWFPNWCSSLRELRVQYFLAALGVSSTSSFANNHNNVIIKSCLLQNKFLSTALLDPVGLASSNVFTNEKNQNQQQDALASETVLLNKMIWNDNNNNNNSQQRTSGAVLLHTLLETFLTFFVRSGEVKNNNIESTETTTTTDVTL